MVVFCYCCCCYTLKLYTFVALRWKQFTAVPATAVFYWQPLYRAQYILLVYVIDCSLQDFTSQRFERFWYWIFDRLSVSPMLQFCWKDPAYHEHIYIHCVSKKNCATFIWRNICLLSWYLLARNYCLHGVVCTLLIHSRQRLRLASSTDVVVPATRRSSLGDRAKYFWSQEHGHGTRYRPVSPPRCLSRHPGDFWQLFCFRNNCMDNVNYCLVVLKCLYTVLPRHSWRTELNWTVVLLITTWLLRSRNGKN